MAMMAELGRSLLDTTVLRTTLSGETLARTSAQRVADVPRLVSMQADRSAVSTQAYEAANKRLAGKYPTLDVVLRDPDAFITDVKGRFAAQQKLTPKTPYHFDFSDYGLPVLKQWVPMLNDEMADLRKKLAALPASSKQAGDLRQTIAHVGDLKGDVAKHLRTGKVNYQELQELSFFISRAMGRSDAAALGLKDRWMLKIDRYLQGHKDVSISQERLRYKNRQMSFFDTTSPVDGFKNAQTSFENALFNRKEMKMVVLPTSEPLGTDIFMRLMNYDLYVTGVTRQALHADGFVRPAADFWVHDARHDSAIFEKRGEYEAKNQMTPAQVAKMTKQVDVWRQELDAATEQLPDPQLRNAVKFYEFNYHHDRGFPMVPSSFTSPKQIEAYVPYLLYRTMYVSKQLGEAGATFGQPKKMLEQAYDFLHQFWQQRLPQEQAILSSKR